MKVVYVMADSLRRDHAGVYGDPPWAPIQAPNLRRFAESAATFENAYIGSFPTVPNRRDTHLGRGDKGLPFNRWKGLEEDEVTFPALLHSHGYPSMLITDTQNNVTGTVNIQRDYTSWFLNRGQEGDRYWLDDTVALEYPVSEDLIRYPAAMWHQVLVNRSHRRTETDWFAPGTYSLAMRWLEKNYTRDSFFLWIDTFDPHEPWDPPQYYIDRYDPGYSGRIFEAPSYGVRSRMGITDRELQNIRARYAGEVTMVDTWFGKLLTTLENLGIADETVVIFCADHGTCFDGPGDQGFLHKLPFAGDNGFTIYAGKKMKAPVGHVPLSQNVARIPLMIRVPGVTDGVTRNGVTRNGVTRNGVTRNLPLRIEQFVQPWDITATILDLFKIPVPDHVIGKSVLPLLRGETSWHRNAAVYGRSTGEPDDDGGQAQVTDGEWTLCLWRGERGPALFRHQEDPDATENLYEAESEQADRLRGQIGRFVRSQGIDDAWIGRYRMK